MCPIIADVLQSSTFFLTPRTPAFAGIRNELIAVIGATATHTPSVPVTPEADKQALIALFNATGGQQWERKANWLTDAPVSLWEGVATDGEGRVIELHLSLNQLSGEIPGELGNLVNLKLLDLSANQLSGEIPGELSNLVNLTYLDLHYDKQLNGEIPGELGNLVNLTSLELSRNQLSGEIPGELGNLVNLEYLYLYNTQLSGCLPRNLIDQLKYFETGGVPFC